MALFSFRTLMEGKNSYNILGSESAGSTGEIRWYSAVDTSRRVIVCLWSPPQVMSGHQIIIIFLFLSMINYHIIHPSSLFFIILIKSTCDH